MKELNINMTFRQVGGIWQRVDSQSQKPPILADTLKKLEIVIDDNCQFCRIIRYYDNIKETIIYRAYGGKITIQRHTR